MKGLLDHLGSHPGGVISDASQLEHLLHKCWQEFDGGDVEGMVGFKLLGRLEDVDWNPPLLSFTIERHGATVAGSSRAELHGWTLDISSKTARCGQIGIRQLRPMAPRLDVKPLADEVVELIMAGQADGRLKWKEGGIVHVQIGKILTVGSAQKQTLEGRRKRFRRRVDEKLGAAGWERLRANVYLSPNP